MNKRQRKKKYREFLEKEINKVFSFKRIRSLCQISSTKRFSITQLWKLNESLNMFS